VKKVIRLDGIWKLWWFDFGYSDGQFRENYDDSTWLDAEVPGEVHYTLLKHGLIKDPFFGKNNEKREWVEKVDWWYRKKFYVPVDFKDKKIELVFEGLDTFATIWVNGVKVASSEDMFLPLRIDVTNVVKIGDWNTIAVRLGAPWYETLRRAGDFSERNLLWNGNYARLYVRKAQYQYGWDWAVKLLTVGIWRSVKMIAYDKAVIRDVYLRTLSISDEEAEVETVIEINSLDDYGGEIALTGKCEDSCFKIREKIALTKGLNKFKIRFKVEKPKLWWPRGYGDQNLYEVKAELYVNGVREDCFETRFGIRTVELVTESNETPNSKVFYLKINGVKVFAKGANWIPADLLISRLSHERYKKLLELVVNANHNMLRVWGGGLVEYDEFYNLCDELGIMLWHDFQFACGHYPEDNEFLKLVEKEVEATVRRLRNHPSIVLWCGNNEDEMFDYYSGFGLTRQKKDFEVIPKVLERLDPSRPYWPSSPWGGSHPNDPSEGDRHNWDVYHGLKPIEHYLEDEARFLSEFGMQALPCLKTLKRFLPHDKMWPINEYWHYHFHYPEKVIPYIMEFGDPRNLREYVFFSQLAQAEALKTAIEHCRRRKFKCGGALYWSFNAPWPNMCWEIVDYYGVPKMAYYFVKRSFSPVIVSPIKKDDTVEVWIVNDTLKEVSGALIVEVVDTVSGEVIKSFKDNFKVPANSSILKTRYKVKDLVEDFTRRVLMFQLTYAGETYKTVLFLAKHRDVIFGEAKLAVDIDEIIEDGEVRITRLAIKNLKGCARLVHIESDGSNVHVSDNFFDLKKNELIYVTVEVPKEYETTLTISAFNAPPLKIKLGEHLINRC